MNLLVLRWCIHKPWKNFSKKKQTNRNSFIAFRVFHPPSLPFYTREYVALHWPVHSCALHGPDVINIHSDGTSEGGGGVCRSGISDTLSIATEGCRVGNLVSGSCWMHNPQLLESAWWKICCFVPLFFNQYIT